jgi:hypothetical protein
MRPDDAIPAIFQTRREAEEAALDLYEHGLAPAHLAEAAHGPLPFATEEDPQTAMFRSVVRGVVIGMPLGVILGIVMTVVGMLIAGVPLTPLAVFGAGGWGGFMAGIFFGAIGGASAKGYVFEEDERWAEVPLGAGEVLVVAHAHGDATHVSEILANHHGRVVAVAA